MSAEHERVRELLALAAAEALAVDERCRVERHTAECAACAAELRILGEVARGLRAIPVPKAPPHLAARARAAVLESMARRAEERWNNAMVVVFGLYAWTLGLTVWGIFQLLRGGWIALLDVSFVRMVGWLSLSTVLGWLTAGVAAVLLAHQKKSRRRTWVA